VICKTSLGGAWVSAACETEWLKTRKLVSKTIIIGIKKASVVRKAPQEGVLINAPQRIFQRHILALEALHWLTKKSLPLF
jgi:hypothetical protein